MSARTLVAHFCQKESLNFILSNRIPRRLVTRLVGWFSTIEQPLIRDLSIAIWRFFSDLDLSEAKKTHFASLRDCFIRELKEGARPLDQDPNILIAPCDGIVGGYGRIVGGDLLQVKGSAYPLEELLGDRALAELYRDGCYATLRLTAGMYHRFHAPHDCRVERVRHIWGDTWNLNPAALSRIEKLFCRNERAVICTRLAATDQLITLVPVAAILVAGIRLSFSDLVLDARKSTDLPNDTTFRKGEEMGWFEHGSTIIILAPCDGMLLCETVQAGRTFRMGEALMRLL
jgi:phosphatidylserine decarboxylase